MNKTIIFIHCLFLLNSVVLANDKFNWEGSYSYSTEGITENGSNYVYGLDITVRKTYEGNLFAEVEEHGRIKSNDTIVCSVKISKNNKTMTLYYDFIVDNHSDKSRKKSGLFMSLTRRVIKKKVLFIPNYGKEKISTQPYTKIK